MDPVPDPILPEKLIGFSRDLNPGHLGWQSEVPTTIPNRRSSVPIKLSIKLGFVYVNGPRETYFFIVFTELVIFLCT